MLAAGGVHRRLIEEGLRSSCSLTVRAAECVDSHYTAVLIGVGATCYTAFGADDRLQPGDEVIVVVYDGDTLDLPEVREQIRSGSPLPPGNPVLRQRVG